MLRTTPSGGELAIAGRRRKRKDKCTVDDERSEGQLYSVTNKRPSHRGGRAGHQKGDCEASAGGTHAHKIGRLGRECTHIQGTEGTELQNALTEYENKGGRKCIRINMRQKQTSEAERARNSIKKVIIRKVQKESSAGIDDDECRNN
eukprot:2140920-Heterocapsa_arctica.AAC.1